MYLSYSSRRWEARDHGNRICLISGEGFHHYILVWQRVPCRKPKQAHHVRSSIFLYLHRHQCRCLDSTLMNSTNPHYLWKSPTSNATDTQLWKLDFQWMNFSKTHQGTAGTQRKNQEWVTKARFPRKDQVNRLWLVTSHLLPGSPDPITGAWVLG